MNRVNYSPWRFIDHDRFMVILSYESYDMNTWGPWFHEYELRLEFMEIIRCEFWLRDAGAPAGARVSFTFHLYCTRSTPKFKKNHLFAWKAQGKSWKSFQNQWKCVKSGGLKDFFGGNHIYGSRLLVCDRFMRIHMNMTIIHEMKAGKEGMHVPTELTCNNEMNRAQDSSVFIVM